MTAWRAATHVARKELRDILRERSIAVALLVQFFIAAFSAFLAVGLLALYDPGAVRAEVRAAIAYVGPGGFDGLLDAAPHLDVARTDAAAALDGFQRGTYRAVVQEEWQDPGGTRTVTVLLADGDLQATLLTTQLKSMLQDYEQHLREERQGRLEHTLRTVAVPAAAQQALPYPFLYATLLPLLLLTPVFLSGAVAADSLAAELQSRSLTLLRTVPAPLPALLVGKLLVPLALAPLQFLLWAGLLALNGVTVAHPAVLCGLSLLLTMTLAGCGYALAARLRRDGPTQATYALTSILLAGLSLLLPRDPLNLAALAATGQVDAASWATLGLLAIAAASSLSLGCLDAARSIRRRPD